MESSGIVGPEMDPSEIPAVARTGRSEAVPVAPLGRYDRVLGGWCARNLLIGAAVGILMGTAAQVVIPVLGNTPPGTPEPALWVRAAGVLLTAGCYGAVMLVLSAISGIGLGRPLGRRIAVAASTLLLTGLFAWSVSAVVVRVLAGSHVTIGAVDFFLNSTTHLSSAALDGFSVQLIALGSAVLVVGALIVWSLRGASVATPVTKLRHAAVAAIGLLSAGSLYTANSVGGEATGALWETTPELAMLGSIHTELVESYDASSYRTENGAELEPGPPLEAGAAWQLVVDERKTRPRPNVLVLTLESFSPKHLGYLGYDRRITPNLDRIAARSLRFRRAWTTATHSNYAQMAILSSLFPRRTAGLDVYKRMDYPRVLLHDFFHDADYRTATITSQDETWQGMLRFQTTGTPTYFHHAKDHEGAFFHTGTGNVVPDHLTAEKATKWIAAQPGPWSLYVNFQMAHFPYTLPKSAERPFKNAQPTPGKFNYFDYPEREKQIVINRYDNAVHYVDEQVGKLWWFLRGAGLLDNTIWVITSDHGELFHEHGIVTHGKTLYDGEARVPLLVHYPAKLAARDVNTPVSHLDVLPTIAALADFPSHPSFQGENISRPDQLAANRAIYMNIQGLKTGQAIVCWPYKLIVDKSAKRTMLFDLANDPNELDDLSERRTPITLALAKTLRAQLRAQMRYHHPKHTEQRESRYAPRMLRCPAVVD